MGVKSKIPNYSEMDKYLVKRPHGIILYMCMEQFGPITRNISENARLRICPVLPLMPVKNTMHNTLEESATVDRFLFWTAF